MEAIISWQIYFVEIFLPFHVLIDIFWEILHTRQNWAESYRDSPSTAYPDTCIASLLILKQLVNLHWLIIITQSLQLIWFTQSCTKFMLPMSFEKCIMASIHHYSTLQNCFTPPKSSMVCLLILLYLPLIPYVYS